MLIAEGITEDQARDIALSFRANANAISDYLHDNWAHLSATDVQKLDAAEWDLRTNAFNFRTMLVGLELADLQPAVHRLLSATAQAEKVLKQEAAVKNVLRIAAALVMLGGAITSQNPLAIAGAVGGLVNTIGSG